ncbi:MAG: AraC family transcriptional regulator [Ramlibacter sp.]|nr:AraC family transcriptional regulator [Ramlibacter sp.]
MPRAPADSPRAATPMAFGRAIVAAYRHYGRDPGEALELAQITPAMLHRKQARMTSRQMEVLSATAMRQLDDEALGAFSRPLPWGSYGMLARASLSSPDLGVALGRWCRHHALLADNIRLELAVAAGRAAIAIEERGPLADGAEGREFCLVHVLRNIHGLACWYVDSRIPLLGARFPFAAPAHADVYPLLFPGPVTFGAPRAEIGFDARYLALPLRRDEKALRLMLQHALPLTVRQYRRDRLIVQQVRQALAARPAETHGADGLAAMLHMSPRTLHRQLKEEGASLQRLKDEVRCERAKDLLYRSASPVKQVAAATGFRNEKSFIRAFRQWTGASPAEFRRHMQG